MTDNTGTSGVRNDSTVEILGTGGTIANVTGAYDSTEDFISIHELLRRAPDEVTSDISVSSTEITRVSSGALIPEDWYNLHNRISTTAHGDNSPDGYVVTHGSNTAEETAYFLDRTLSIEQPVVVTAAQRNINHVGRDGFKNLRDSIRVAADQNAKNRGVLLVANQEIHHARDVTKVVSSRPDAWVSPNSGPVGAVLEEIKFHTPPTRRHEPRKAIDISDTTPRDFPLTNVHIVYSSFAENGFLVRSTMEEVAGFIVAGLPTNSVPSPRGLPQQKAALLEAAERDIPVVICHRGLEGFRPVAPPFIGGGSLRPQKARILLALGLLHDGNIKRIRQWFEDSL